MPISEEDFLQTQPRPPKTDLTQAESGKGQASSRFDLSGKRLARLLNLSLGLVGSLVYVLYLTKGATIYSHIPGGRKILLPLALLTFVGLVAGRVYVGLGKQTLLTAPVRVWQRAKVREWAAVSLIFLLAFGLRLEGINFGLPNLEHVDEWAVADRALHIVQTGNFDPLDYRNPALPNNDRQAFTYPTLYTYMETGVFAARFLQGVAADKYEAVANVTTLTVKPDFYLWGRALTALLGALTAVVVYVVAKRFYGQAVGLVAAIFLSFFYLQAINSHWITTDVPSGFFALLPFLFIWGILAGRDNWKIYAVTGLLAGLAVATKYNNGLILLPVVLAHLLGRPPRRWFNWNLPLAGVATFAGFFIGVPFAFFHIPNFLTDVAEIINHYQNIGHAGYQGNDNWLYYLQAISYENLAILGLGLVGLLLAFMRHRRRDIVLVSFPLISYLQLSSYKVNFTRNLMPIIPFLAILAGLALVTILDKLFSLAQRRWPVLFVEGKPTQWRYVAALSSLTVLAIIGPAFSIVNYDVYNAKPTTRALALNWSENNLPRGSKLWLEPGSLELLPPAQYQLGGGDSVLAHPIEWYAANNFNYLVLSEATYKDLYLKGDPAYKKLIDGPRPANLTLVKAFRHNDSNQPGPTLIILSTGLPTVATSSAAYNIQRPLQLNLGQLKLIGADLRANVKAGQTLPIVLYWQTLTTPQANYTVFVHLLNTQGQTVAQLDLMPLANTRPTSTWKPGDILRDPYPLPLPAKLPPGNYELHVGMYEAGSGARLKTTNGQDEIDLGSVEVK